MVRIEPAPGAVRISAEGGTTGIARGIYKVDFEFFSEMSAPGLELRQHRLTERYRSVCVENEARIVPEGVRLSRKGYPATPGKPEKERVYAVQDAVDLTGALLRFRSLPLAAGDTAVARVCHGDRIYLARIEVKARETRSFGGVRRDAIRVSLALSKMGKRGGLEPHKKFRSATGWFSDDEQRDLLRVEGEIFIGKLFAELEPG